MKASSTASVIISLLISFIVALGVTQRINLIQFFTHPNFAPDSWGYASIAHEIFDKGTHSNSSFRELFYPIFLYILIYIGGYKLVGIIQMLMSLAAPIIVHLTWMRFSKFIPCSTAIYHRFLGVLLLLILMFHGGNLLSALTIGPEILFIFLLSLLLYLLARAATADTPKIQLITTSAAISLSIILYFIRGHWLLSAIFACITAGFILMGTRATILKKAVSFALPILIIFSTAEIISNTLRDSPKNQDQNIFLPGTLACWHAPIVAPELDKIYYAENARNNFLRLASEELMSSLLQKDGYQTLGWNADYCMYKTNFRKYILQAYDNDAQRASAVLKSSFLRAVISHPLWYTNKVWHQWEKILERPMGYEVERGLLSDNFLPLNANSPSFQKFIPEISFTSYFDSQKTVPLGAGKYIRLLTRFSNNIFVFLILYTGLLIIYRINTKQTYQNKFIFVTTLIAAPAWIGISLTCALVHSLEVNRYINIQTPATIITMMSITYFVMSETHDIISNKIKGRSLKR